MNFLVLDTQLFNTSAFPHEKKLLAYKVTIFTNEGFREKLNYENVQGERSLLMDYRDDAFSTFGEEMSNSSGIEFVRTPLADQFSQTDDSSSMNIAVNLHEPVNGEGRDVPDSEVIDINETEVASTETIEVFNEVINVPVVWFIQRMMADSSEEDEEEEDAEGEGEEGEELEEDNYEGEDEVDN